jgi:hypothetical protein
MKEEKRMREDYAEPRNPGAYATRLLTVALPGQRILSCKLSRLVKTFFAREEIHG